MWKWFWESWLDGEDFKLWWILAGVIVFPILLLLVILLTIWEGITSVIDAFDGLFNAPRGFDTSLWHHEHWRRYKDLGHPYGEYDDLDPRIYGCYCKKPCYCVGREWRYYATRVVSAPDVLIDTRPRTKEAEDAYWADFYSGMAEALRKRAEWEKRNRLVMLLGLDRTSRMKARPYIPRMPNDWYFSSADKW